MSVVEKRRALGQHFLISPAISKQLIDAAALSPKDTVFEIGTGRGILTQEIAPNVDRVISYEKDHVLVSLAGQKLSHCSNVNLIEGDAFTVLPYIRFDVLIASLPYSKSLQFIRMLSLRSGSFRCAACIIQLDFAKKLLAEPHESNYRAVSVIAQISFSMQNVAVVDSTNFEPPPKVQSEIVKFEPNRDFRQPFFDKQRIRLLLQLFSFRGRRLRNALKSVNGFQDSPLHKSVSSKRVEELCPSEFARILETISSSSVQK